MTDPRDNPPQRGNPAHEIQVGIMSKLYPRALSFLSSAQAARLHAADAAHREQELRADLEGLQTEAREAHEAAQRERKVQEELERAVQADQEVVSAGAECQAALQVCAVDRGSLVMSVRAPG